MPENISDIDKALGSGNAQEEGWDNTQMADDAPIDETTDQASSETETETPVFTEAQKAEYESKITELQKQVEAQGATAELTKQVSDLATKFADFERDADSATSRLDNDTGGGSPTFDARAAMIDEDFAVAVFIEGLAELMQVSNPSFNVDEIKSNISDWKKETLPKFDETTSQLDAMGQTPSLQRTLTIALEPMLRMRRWFVADRGKPTTGSRSYPVIGQLTASFFAENDDVPSLGPIPMSNVTITQTKFGGEIPVTGETRRFSDIPYMTMVRRVLLAAMNRFHEAKGRDAMFNAEVDLTGTMAAADDDFGTSTKSEAAAGSNTFATEAAPFEHRRVLLVTKVTYDPAGAITGPIILFDSDPAAPVLGTTDFNIDYHDGIIELTSGGLNDIGGVTNTTPARVDIEYIFSNRRPGTDESDFSNAHYVDVATDGTLAWEDAVRARRLVKGADGDANVLWTDPTKMEDLLNDTQFVTGGSGMAEKTVMEGAIDRVGGLNAFESTVQFDEVAIVFMAGQNGIGWESIGSDLITRTYIPDSRVDDQRIAAQILNAFAVTRPEVITIILNAQANANKAPVV